MVVLAAFVSASAFAGMEINPNVGDSSASSAGTSTSRAKRPAKPASERNTIVTLETLSEASSYKGKVDDQSQSFSGNSVLAGLAASITSISDSGFGIEGRAGLLEKKFDTFSAGDQSAKGPGQSSVKLLTLRASGTARYYPVQYFSVGAGAYASEYIGDEQDTSEDGTHSSQSFTGKRFDFGPEFSARGEIPIGANFSVVADARYYLGLANVSDSSDAAHTRDFELGMGAGFRF
jgi:hypothetical protein